MEILSGKSVAGGFHLWFIITLIQYSAVAVSVTNNEFEGHSIHPAVCLGIKRTTRDEKTRRITAKFVAISARQIFECGIEPEGETRHRCAYQTYKDLSSLRLEF